VDLRVSAGFEFAGIVVLLLEVWEELLEYIELGEEVGGSGHELGELIELEVFDVDLGGDDAGRPALVGEEGLAETVDVVLLSVDLRKFLELVVGHIGERAGIAGGPEGGAGEGGPAEIEGELPVGGAGVVAQLADDGDVCLHTDGIFAEVGEVFGEELLVFGDLVMDVIAGFGSEVAVVDPFDGGLEAERDEKADGDGGDVEEEVAPAVDGLVGWVDVEDGGRLLLGGRRKDTVWSFGVHRVGATPCLAA